MYLYFITDFACHGNTAFCQKNRILSLYQLQYCTLLLVPILSFIVDWLFACWYHDNKKYRVLSTKFNCIAQRFVGRAPDVIRDGENSRSEPFKCEEAFCGGRRRIEWKNKSNKHCCVTRTELTRNQLNCLFSFKFIQ